MTDDPTCTWCGRPVPWRYTLHHPFSPTREHLKPRGRGGAKGGDNVALAHRICNNLRGMMDERAFRALMNGEHVTKEELWPWVDWEEVPPPAKAPGGRRRHRRKKPAKMVVP